MATHAYQQRQVDEAALRLQHQQLKNIQKQRTRLQKQLLTRIEQIEAKQQEKDEEMKQREQNILSRLQKTEFLNEAISKHYGVEAQKKAYSNYSAVSLERERSPKPRLIDDLLAQRNREQHQRQQQYMATIDSLNRERQNLLDERLNLDDYKRDLFLASPISDTESVLSDSDWQRFGQVLRPPPLSPPSSSSVHAVQSFVEKTKDQLPDDIDRYHRMREQYDDDYERLYKPYNGEYGIQTYEPWQMKDYHMVRSIVEEEVDRVLNMFFLNLPPAVDKETALALMDAEARQMQNQRQSLVEAKAARLIIEQYILEMTSTLATEVANEFLYIYQMVSDRTDQLVITEAERVASEADEERDVDSAYDLITKTFVSLQRERDRYRKHLWTHSQYVMLKGPQQQLEEPDDGDLSVLHFDDITPSDLQQSEPQPWDSEQEKDKKLRYQTYLQEEADYWKNMMSNITSVSLSKKTNGVNTASLSPNHRYLAVGTVHGDLLTFNLWSSPPHILRVTHSQLPYDNSIEDIAWSMDSFRILNTTEQGTLELWSMASQGPQKADLKALDLRADGMGVAPSLPNQLLSLDAMQGDLSFQSGGIARLGGQKSNKTILPTRVAFYPSLTLLGTQHSICVSLDNGDILKLDTEEGRRAQDDTILYTPRVIQPNLNQNANTIGQEISTELFRHHRHPVVLLGFINNTSDMISVDDKGHINVWKYTKSEMTSFEWFSPHKKSRLNMSKTMYTATPNTKPNIVFTDKSKDSAKSQQPQTRQDIAAKRQQVQDSITALKLGNPWHQEYFEDQDLLTEYYPPTDGVPESGAAFHIIVRHMKTNQLSTYVTKLYSPVKVFSKRFVGCQMSPTGDYVVFLLLFPPYPPKQGHLTLVSLDLQSLKIQNFRRDIPLSDTQYQKCLNEDVVSFSISRVISATGSAYVFVNIDGALSAYSMNTGTKVLKMREAKLSKESSDGFLGYLLNTRGHHIANNAQFVLACTQGKLTVVIYAKNQKKKVQNQLLFVELTGRSSEQQLQQMASAFSEWNAHPELPPKELMLDMQAS